MPRSRSVLVLVAIFFSIGCYHASVDTGLTPSTVQIKRGWAAGWIYGLVPPSTTETAQKCPSGVAKVDTQLSFANQLVNVLTLGIYTPMEIVVTCAAPRTSDSADVLEVGSRNPSEVIAEAANLSLVRKAPVEVQF